MMNAERMEEMTHPLAARLPKARGKLRFYADLSKTNWFQVGGPADILFKPEDAQDLADFIANCPKDIPITVVGVGSNLLVRDNGLEGVVIRLGRGFTEASADKKLMTFGAAVMSQQAAAFSCEQGLAGLEFLSGIPGTIGGALAMNAGAYGRDVAAILVEAEAVDPQGKIHTLLPEQINYHYRGHDLPPGWIFTRGTFRGEKGEVAEIADRIRGIGEERSATQPVRSRTGGSTFKNPTVDGKPGKAWELIDRAGCRGLMVGAAQVSEKHCNFLINTGGATAKELESLGEEVRKRVKEKFGVELEWEIKRIGRA